MIEVKNLVYEYPTRRILDGLTFTIPQGAIVGLAGENGSGKSTLIECLAGIKKPNEGQIYINGTNITEKPHQSNHLVGFLPTFYGLYDVLTVKQCLMYFALAQKIAKSEIKNCIKEIAQQLHINQYMKVQVATLSRGIRQRLAIAQTLIHSPQLLLLEKPTTGLDYPTQKILFDLIENLGKKGVTIIIASHQIEEFLPVASDVLLLENGKIAEYKPIRESLFYKQAFERNQVLYRTI